MSFPFSIHRLAELELERAADFYFEINPDLEAEFLECIHEAVWTICRSPKAYPVVFRNIRRKPESRFHYNIYFAFEHGHVRILSVVHQSSMQLSDIDRS
jgi:toxin ParE1/3/4